MRGLAGLKGVGEVGRRLAGLVGAINLPGRPAPAPGDAAGADGLPAPLAVSAGEADQLPLLSLVGVRKRFTLGPVAVEVLKGADLDVRRGDLLSIMGASGSGKSTLMNILGLLDRPTSGSCKVGGVEVSALSDNELSDIRNRSIGWVFQSFFLLPRLTAWENVALPLIYRGLTRPELRARAARMLDRVGIGDLAEHRPTQLSGGQQQRVAIARGLVGEPTILLADEPTGALDPETGKEIMRLFVRLNSEDGVSVVIITHDPNVARQCARNTRIVDGAIEETDAAAGAPGSGP